MELPDLIERIRKEAGFEVYIWAADRYDLNDWPEQQNESQDNYTRAVSNLINLNPGKSNFDSFINSTTCEAIGGFAGFDNDFNVVAYGLFPRMGYFEEEELTERYVEKKKKGFAGFLGFKEWVPVEGIEKITKLKCYGSIPLSKIVSSQDDGDAYFVRLTIKSDILDAPGRRMITYPSLTIIGSQDLVKTIVEYLENNPEEYMEFIKSALPAEEFPNVNKGIIDISQPFDRLVFLDANKIDCSLDTKGVPNRELKDWVYQKYGKFVEVPQ
ncbi:MAG: hypothetical protein KJ847_01565 [Firmicutes bacterium]|nr:hypothetical protein [Bacillota bacterium]